MHVDVSALSEDELHTVLSFLDLYSLLTLTKSAKKWRVTALAKEDRYWQSIYSKYHIIQPEEKSYYDALHYKTLTKNWRGKNDLLTTNIGAKQKNKTYVKCVLLGNSGVGRTSLCFMLGGGLEVMNQAYTAPPHMAYDSDSCKTVLVGDTYVNVNFWDTEDVDERAEIRKIGSGSADVFMVCFAVNDPKSFHAAFNKWILEANDVCPNAPVILVGTKADASDRMISSAEASHLAYITNCVAYYELSIKTPLTSEPFHHLVFASRLPRSEVKSKKDKCSVQ